MTRRSSARLAVVVCSFVLTCAANALAQSGSSATASGQSATQSSSDTTPVSTRPATTTFFGDTGLWFVPTAEVVPQGRWAASGYRRGTNYIQGYSNVADFAGTFSFGIKDRAEVFGSFLFDTRIDRDLKPLFGVEPAFAGIIDRYPRVAVPFTGNKVGDFYVGVKYNIWSAYRQKPVSLAVRAMVKLPTGDSDAGVSTGKADGLFDFIISKEAARVAEVSGYAGFEVRGQPDGVSTSGGAFRWGAGVGVPSRSPIRFTGELTGIVPSGSTATLTTPIVGIGYDGERSVSPLVSDTEKLTRATAGITVQVPKGFFVGVGASWNVPRQTRLPGRTAADDNDPTADYWDFQVRIGYHPGVRVYVPPPPPPPPPPLPPPPPQNRPPTVRARCEPCTVEVGRTSTVTADAQDPDGDALTYRWSAPAGTFANPADRQTIWTAPQQEGPVPVTVTVSDGKGGTATDTVRIQVIRPAPVVELTFEDVYFDFDRYSLRPEAVRLLDDAVTKLQANPDKQLIIEGHTCNIGTAEYNLALAERRANAVRTYLLSRGIAAGRLETRSYGEERPKYDNAREETRRLNRRAALVVKVQ
jgi:outer membrane protein OmpA-like peptidoglycan-associated protein